MKYEVKEVSTNDLTIKGTGFCCNKVVDYVSSDNKLIINGYTYQMTITVFK